MKYQKISQNRLEMNKFMKELQRLKNENDNEYLEKLTKFLDEEVDKSVLLIKRKKEERLRNFKNDFATKILLII